MLNPGHQDYRGRAPRPPISDRTPESLQFFYDQKTISKRVFNTIDLDTVVDRIWSSPPNLQDMGSKTFQQVLKNISNDADHNI